MPSFSRKHPIVFGLVVGILCGIIVLGALSVYDTMVNWQSITHKDGNAPPAPGWDDVAGAVCLGIFGAIPGAVVGLIVGLLMHGFEQRRARAEFDLWLEQRVQQASRDHEAESNRGPT
jgi:uncharacterized membrane-anchored protein YhcB (DUF1043 family)